MLSLLPAFSLSLLLFIVVVVVSWLLLLLMAKMAQTVPCWARYLINVEYAGNAFR